jgi:hypothetical protein
MNHKINTDIVAATGEGAERHPFLRSSNFGHKQKIIITKEKRLVLVTEGQRIPSYLLVSVKMRITKPKQIPVIASNTILMRSSAAQWNTVWPRLCPFWLGLPGLISSGRILNWIHHFDNSLSPPIASEAKGAPLSVRIACGKPYWRNTTQPKV